MMHQFVLSIIGAVERLFGLSSQEPPLTAEQLEFYSRLTVRVIYGKVPLPAQLENLAVGHLMFQKLVGEPRDEQERLIEELEERGWFDPPTPMTEYMDWYMEKVIPEKEASREAGENLPPAEGKQ